MRINYKLILGILAAIVLQTLILITIDYYFAISYPQSSLATSQTFTYLSHVFSLKDLSYFLVISFFSTVLSIVIYYRVIRSQFEDLAASQRRLALTQELSNVGSWELDLVKNKLTWSDEVFRIFGLMPQEFEATYEAFLQAVHPEDRDLVNNAYSNSLNEGKDSYEVEHRVVRAQTGEIRFVLERCVHFKDKNGKVIRSIGMVQDLTNKKISEQQRKQLEKQFKAVIDVAPIPFAINNAKLEISYLNPAFINLFGYSLEDIPTLEDWWPKAYPDKSYQSWVRQKWDEHLKIIKDKSLPPRPLEVEVTCKNGSKKKILASATSLEADHQGDFLILLQDVTEARAQEEIMRRATKMEALGSLTGGIAHDYNNMLGVILGFAELLGLNTELDDKQKQYLEEIIKAGQRSQNLTQNLLNFAKKKAKTYQKTDINQLITADQSLIAKTLTSRVQLKLKLQNNLWSVQIDPLSFEDALINISINSMHAMPQGGEFEIKTENKVFDQKNLPLGTTLQPGEYVVMSLTDTGKGMDEKTLNRIFDPFFTTKPQGTGMGMSQVYSFVNQSNGEIKVESKVGQGTKVTIYLPRFIQTTHLVTASEPEAVITSKRTGIILVVDDEVSMLNLYKDALKAAKHQILTANSAKEALMILNNNKVDLLISDVLMPDMDGYSLAAQVSKQSPHTKIQLISGYHDHTKLENINKDLQERILNKPVKLSKLLERIDELLSHI